MSASIVHLAELEDVSTHELSTTEPAASEDEARRHAEDAIRQKPNLRLIRIYSASATVVGQEKMTVNTLVIRRPLYDTDIALWAEQQADLLRRRASNELDWLALAEEIEDVARRERDQIESRLSVLCEHLLKWQFQSERRSGSWRGSIVEARDRIARVVRNSPSLHSYPAVVLAEAYAAGRRKAEAETELTDLPTECPWTIEQVRDHDFWPDE
jgi:hypothetical protein